MKFNRVLIASAMGLSFLATSSAIACQGTPNRSNHDQGQHHWSFLGLGWYNNMLNGTGGYSDNNHGKECDNGHGNDSSGCEVHGGGSSSGGGSQSSGGGTTSGGGSTSSGGGIAGSGKGSY